MRFRLLLDRLECFGCGGWREWFHGPDRNYLESLLICEWCGRAGKLHVSSYYEDFKRFPERGLLRESVLDNRKEG